MSKKQEQNYLNKSFIIGSIITATITLISSVILSYFNRFIPEQYIFNKSYNLSYSYHPKTSFAIFNDNYPFHYYVYYTGCDTNIVYLNDQIIEYEIKLVLQEPGIISNIEIEVIDFKPIEKNNINSNVGVFQIMGIEDTPIIKFPLTIISSDFDQNLFTSNLPNSKSFQKYDSVIIQIPINIEIEGTYQLKINLKYQKANGKITNYYSEIKNFSFIRISNEPTYEYEKNFLDNYYSQICE